MSCFHVQLLQHVACNNCTWNHGIRLHCLHAVHRCSLLLRILHLAWSVCLCVGHIGQLCKKHSSSILKQAIVGPSNLVLDRVMGVQNPHGMELFDGKVLAGCNVSADDCFHSSAVGTVHCLPAWHVKQTNLCLCYHESDTDVQSKSAVHVRWRLVMQLFSRLLCIIPVVIKIWPFNHRRRSHGGPLFQTLVHFRQKFLSGFPQGNVTWFFELGNILGYEIFHVYFWEG